MALIELKQYESAIFPNLDVSQKAIVDILEAFRHLKESHVKISNRNDDDVNKLNSKFNDLVARIAKGSLKKSMDLKDFTEYFKTLTEDNVASNDLLQTLLVLKDMTKQRISQSLKDNIKPSISASNVRQPFTQSYLSGVNLTCLNLVIISGYSIYDLILTHLETLIQFWKQQYDIFESHINALRSMDGNVNLRLSKHLTAGIIERFTDKEINCKGFHQMLNDGVFLKIL
nr:4364_t:CDS:2 [Entrophospora candida]